MSDDRIAFLIWFYEHVNNDVKDILSAQYEQQTGKPIPPGFRNKKPRHISVRTLGMVIDFTDEDTRRLHRDLCEVYNTEDQLVTLLQQLGIGPGDIPFKSTTRDTWQAVLIDLNNRMKIGQLLNLVSW